MDLRNRTDETVTIFLIRDDQRVCVEKIDSSHEPRPVLNKGDHYPLHAGAAGKLLLAYLPAAKRKEILAHSGPPRLTPNTISRMSAMGRELQKIYREGYALSFQERASHVCSVAAPIMDFRGEVIAAQKLSAPSVRFTPGKVKEFIAMVRDTAKAIAQAILVLRCRNSRYISIRDQLQ